MRVLPVLFAAMVFAGPALAEKPKPEVRITYEADTYRFGTTYRSERGTSIEDCAMLCSRDGKCASWSLTPATFRIGPRCELKIAPGAASHRPGAASGMAEVWQMDADRHAELRYQTQIPASRQPAAVPLDQLRPSPAPRVFGDPPPVREPELMGGPETRISAVMRPAPVQASPEVMIVPPQSVSAPRVTAVAAAPKSVAPSPRPVITQVAVAPAPKDAAPKQPVEVLRGPGQGETPKYVKQPAPVEPHPLYRAPVRDEATPSARMVFKDPSLNKAPAVSTTADYNAVLKRESQTPKAQPAAAPVQMLPAPRAPWTERDGTTPDYSVGGSDFIPGDEDATAGFVDGVPEAGS
ncbi:MAG: PAN domain-containing protein [Pseudomonadota bacterium]